MLKSLQSPVSHKTVTCDLCHKNPLEGPRFVCLNCRDYDVCVDCYNPGVMKHPETHHFLLLRTPNPLFSIQVPLNPLPVSEAREHQGISCDFCFQTPVSGLRLKCCVCPDFDLCASCVPCLLDSQRHDMEHVFLLLPKKAVSMLGTPKNLQESGFIPQIRSLPKDTPILPLIEPKDDPKNDPIVDPTDSSNPKIIVTEKRKQIRFVEVAKTVHPDDDEKYKNPLIKGDIFHLESQTLIGDEVEVTRMHERLSIKKDHVTIHGEGYCPPTSCLDQVRRRIKAEKSPPILQNKSSSLPSVEEMVVTNAQINACLAGGLCAICFTELDNPRCLPCSHGFCERCVQSSIRASNAQPPYKCPLCTKLIFLDEESIGNLQMFEYDKELLKELNTSTKGTGEEDSSIGYPCKSRGCDEQANHYCKKCGINGTHCATHAEMHTEVFAGHEMCCLEYGTLLSNDRNGKCKLHEKYPLEYFCSECIEHPVKCAKCAYVDHEHIPYHSELLHPNSSYQYIIDERIGRLRKMEELYIPNISHIEQMKHNASQEYKKASDELSKWVSDVEDQISHFKVSARKQLESSNQSIISRLEEYHSQLICDMQAIQIAKQSLAALSKRPQSNCSLTEVSNAVRFANQVIHSKKLTPVHITPFTLSSKLNMSIIDELKKMNDSFVYGMKNAETKQQQVLESRDTVLHSVIQTRPSEIPKNPNIRIDSISDETKIEHPWGICVHPNNGNIYVTDEDLQTILVFDKNLRHIYSHRTGLAIPHPLHGPRGIAISKQGLIAVADCEAHMVKLYTDDFTLVKTIGGQKGDGKGHLNRPYSVAFDAKGNIYVADSGNKRVQKFDSKGEHVSYIGTHNGDGELHPFLVNGVCITEQDKLMVTCAGSDTVRIFSTGGVFEASVKLEVETSTGGWSHIFCAPQGVFGICEYEDGTICFYDGDGKVHQRLTLDGCLGACFGLDGAFYATSLSQRAIFKYSLDSK